MIRLGIACLWRLNALALLHLQSDVFALRANVLCPQARSFAVSMARGSQTYLLSRQPNASVRCVSESCLRARSFARLMGRACRTRVESRVLLSCQLSAFVPHANGSCLRARNFARLTVRAFRLLSAKREVGH